MLRAASSAGHTRYLVLVLLCIWTSWCVFTLARLESVQSQLARLEQRFLDVVGTNPPTAPPIASSEAPQFTRAVGLKLHPDGNFKRFIGNTVVANVLPSSSHFRMLERAQQILNATSCGWKYSFLHPQSFHMTVLDLYAPLSPIQVSESDQLVTSAMRRASVQRVWPHHLNMTFSPILTFMDQGYGSQSIGLAPADSKTAMMLKEFRDAASAAANVRHENHSKFRFHVSLAYRSRMLTSSEKMEVLAALAKIKALFEREFGTMLLPVAHLAFFNDMASYPDTRQPYEPDW